MLRKIAAGTSAAVVAAGLAAAPAVAAGIPASPGEVCGDATPTEQASIEGRTTQGFVFGPLADVLHLRSAGPSCATVTPVVTDFSDARRRSASPPPVGTPTPEAPSSPPPDDSAPEAPAPVDSGPPPSAGPPVETAVPAADTSSPLPPVPVEAGPPPAPRAALGGPGESVLPETQPPPRAPSRLPQTAGETRPLTVAGGGSLIAAGLAWIGGARRRRKRAADPSLGD